MRERVHRFGSHGGLVGVTCEPDGGGDGARPAALLSNVGLNHRVGPNRLWVDLARRLAASGFTSLRFDLSGLGDSEARPGGGAESERALADTREAMDFLARHRGRDQFVLIANCSGVDSLHATTLNDPRVSGAVAIDGYAYRNRGYWLRRRTTCLLQWSRWRRVWRRRRYGVPDARREPGERQEVWVRDIPTREAFARDLGAMVGRGVRLLFVYTSGADQVYNHRTQFEQVFGRHPRVEVDFYPPADHLFSREADRRWLLDRVDGWMGRYFAPSA